MAPAHSSGVRLSGVLVDVVNISPSYLGAARSLILPEPLGEVLVRPVAQDGDDDTVLDPARHLERRRDRGPGRYADQDPSSRATRLTIS